MKTILDPYKWALEEMRKDIREIIGKNHNTRIVWYHGHTTLKATDDETAWCSAFMCAAAEANGFKSTRSALARSWLNYGEEGKGEVGDIVVLSANSRGPNAGHVGFLASPYRQGDTLIAVLGGNQSNMLRVSNYQAKDLLAFRKFVI